MRLRDQDRRSHTRVKSKTIIRVFVAGVDQEVCYDGILDEISNAGFSFTLGSPVAIEGRIKIEIPYIFNSEKLKIPGTITWHDEANLRFGGSFKQLAEPQIQALRAAFRELNNEWTSGSLDRRQEDRRNDVRQLKQDLETSSHIIRQIDRQLRSRVAVTGMGIVSPIGIGPEAVWKSISNSKSSIRLVSSEDSETNGGSFLAARVELDPTQYLDAKRVRRLHRHSQMACIAATLAMEDSRFKINGRTNERFGVFEGTSMGGIETIFEQHRIYLSKGPDKVNPLVLLSGSLGDSASEISMLLHLNGPSHTICTGSASSADAIGLGMRAIQRGDVDIALVGGSEMPLMPELVNTFKKMGVLASERGNASSAMRPFDSERAGFALGEGATFLVIERLDMAVRRGAPIYAELMGYGYSCDAYHPSASDPLGRGLATAIINAIHDSDLDVSDIEYVNMHGTATLAGDRGETRAMKRAFGNHARKMFFSSTKPLTGHLLGASGALEAAITMLAMQHGCIPPTLNLRSPDPECDLNFVPLKLMVRRFRTALSVNSGFGGKNAALIFHSSAQ